MFCKSELIDAANLVYRQVPPTPQYVWPLLCERAGATVWVKHENHTPAGSFKIRGGVTFIDWIKRTYPEVRGIITATRGNHGQSQARAAVAAGLQAKIVVPDCNSPEKNAAMRGFGGDVCVCGTDLEAARTEAMRLSAEQGFFLVPSFHREIVIGVASYALELFTKTPNLDTVYVPVGCGSGLCAVIMVRDLLGLKTKIVGVVSAAAPGAKLSFESGKLTATTECPLTIADGLAVRSPVQEAFDIYARGADRILAVNDDEVRNAIRILYHDTHNLAEGAGAASLAALLQEKDRMQGKEVAIILSGGNIDAPALADILRDKIL